MRLLSCLLLLLLATVTTAADWPAIPRDREVLNWRAMMRQTQLPAWDPVASGGVVDGWNGEIVAVFREVDRVDLPDAPRNIGDFTLRIGHLVGGSYAPFDVYLQDRKLGRTEAGGARPTFVVSEFRTGLMPGLRSGLNLRQEKVGPLGLVFVQWVPAVFAPLPDAEWQTAAVPAGDLAWNTKGKVGYPTDIRWQRTRMVGGTLTFPQVGGDGQLVAVIHLHKPGQWTSVSWRLSGTGPIAMTANGEQVLEVAAGETAAQGTFPSHKLNWGVSRLVISMPARDGASFHLETAAVKGMHLVEQVPLFFDPDYNLTGWPKTEIANDRVKAELPLPDVDKGFYRSHRFEQAGIVTRLEHAGHTFFSIFRTEHAPMLNDNAAGPAEEWGDPIAYEDAAVGEPFIKIGVGCYRKEYEDSYFWGFSYWQLDLFPWETEVTANAVDFHQAVDGPRGWGYDYRKKLILPEGKAELRIEHEFTNTGKHRIRSAQYAHNFILVDGHPGGPGYEIAFNFNVVPFRTFDGRLDRKQNVFMPTDDKTYFSPLAGWTTPGNAVATVRRPESGAGVEISGDFAPARIWLFGNGNAICPEPYYQLDVAPGETARWTRVYRFLVDGQ